MVSDREITSRELRANLADVLNEAAVRGVITYVTVRGRRIAAIVPVTAAETLQQTRSDAAR